MEPNLNEALELVEQMDAVLRGAKVVPLTPQVRVDRGELLTILDRMRVSLGAPPKDEEIRHGSSWWR